MKVFLLIDSSNTLRSAKGVEHRIDFRLQLHRAEDCRAAGSSSKALHDRTLGHHALMSPRKCYGDCLLGASNRSIGIPNPRQTIPEDEPDSGDAVVAFARS